MEHFQPLKRNNNVCLVYLQSKLKQNRYSWYIHLLKCLKSKEKTHLEARKQQTRSCLTYLDVWKMEKWYGWCFEVQIAGSKIDGTFSAVRNNEQGCLGVFTVSTATRYLGLRQLRVKMLQNCRNNIFTSTKTTNKVPCHIFRALKVGTKVRLVFWRRKNNNKGLMEHFQPLKTNNKVCVVYL